MNHAPKDIARILLDVTVDANVRQRRREYMSREYGPFVAGGTDFRGCRAPIAIDLEKDQKHMEKVRTYLHEVAHCYAKYILHDEDMDDEKIEALAAEWQKVLYE